MEPISIRGVARLLGIPKDEIAEYCVKAESMLKRTEVTE